MATAALLLSEVSCCQVCAIQLQHQTAAKEAPAKQHACNNQQVPQQPAVGSLKPVVPSLGLEHPVVATASKLDSNSAIPATCTTAGNNKVSHDKQQSQQQQPVSGEQPQVHCGVSSPDSPEQQACQPSQAQHSALSQAQHTPNSQAENGSSIAVLRRQMLDSPRPRFAATNNARNPAATEDCGGSHDATNDTLNQVQCCL